MNSQQFEILYKVTSSCFCKDIPIPFSPAPPMWFFAAPLPLDSPRMRPPADILDEPCGVQFSRLCKLDTESNKNFIEHTSKPCKTPSMMIDIVVALLRRSGILIVCRIIRFVSSFRILRRLSHRQYHQGQSVSWRTCQKSLSPHRWRSSTQRHWKAQHISDTSIRSVSSYSVFLCIHNHSGQHCISRDRGTTEVSSGRPFC